MGDSDICLIYTTSLSQELNNNSICFFLLSNIEEKENMEERSRKEFKQKTYIRPGRKRKEKL